MFEAAQTGEDAIRRAAALLVASRYRVALVGAGISQASGVPTYRGAGGLWTRDGEPPLDQFRRFLADPRAWWEARLEEEAHPGELAGAIAAARPNAAHLALADLERRGLLQLVITQNIDNLHQASGTRSILEIHGNRTRFRCIHCQKRYHRAELALDVLPPQCSGCGGIVKSDTVMFGEPIPRGVLDDCYTAAAKADCMLIIGTSAVVYPAAELPLVARRAGADSIEVNIEDTPLTPYCSVVLRGSAPDVFGRLLAELDAGSAQPLGGSPAPGPGPVPP